MSVTTTKIVVDGFSASSKGFTSSQVNRVESFTRQSMEEDELLKSKTIIRVGRCKADFLPKKKDRKKKKYFKGPYGVSCANKAHQELYRMLIHTAWIGKKVFLGFRFHIFHR
ncbi:uncharacterized protein LOC141535384 isoform X2 [Cotesia typhae]|uniref:uncharacterized protein LOC141535384 isoform X2 n=1 Tax=Cotesia typhae TaxID=2053667 RepID=UPI003D69C2D9